MAGGLSLERRGETGWSRTRLAPWLIVLDDDESCATNLKAAVNEPGLMIGFLSSFSVTAADVAPSV
jgi:hypothetical protein